MSNNFCFCKSFVYDTLIFTL